VVVVAADELIVVDTVEVELRLVEDEEEEEEEEESLLLPPPLL